MYFTKELYQYHKFNGSKKYRYQAVKQKEPSKLKIKRQDYNMK